MKILFLALQLVPDQLRMVSSLFIKPMSEYVIVFLSALKLVHELYYILEILRH